MSEARFEIGKMVNTSFEVYKDNFITLFVAGLIAFAMMITLLLIPAAVTGMYRLCIRALRGERIEIGDLFQGFDGFLGSLGLLVIIAVGVSFGFVLLVIPGVYLAVIWSMAFQVKADNPETGVIDALSQSRELVQGQFWPVFLASLVLGLIAVAASLVPLGSFLALPFFYAGGAYIYLKLKGPSLSQPPVA